MHEVEVTPRSADGFRAVLTPALHAELEESLDRLAAGVQGRRVWEVNSSASGGGVAELLASLLPYVRGAGVDVHWLVVDGNDRFFALTKRLHNLLHESGPGDATLTDADRAAYDDTLAAARDELLARAEPGDVVVLHDPQTVGLAPALAARGLPVVWRCHVGVDTPGPRARAVWDFLRADVAAVSAALFSRPAYVWDGLDPDRVGIVAPCLDVLSAKNRPLDASTRDAILAVTGLVPGEPTVDPGVARAADMMEDAPVAVDARLVVQVSRWDRLKDPVGVLRAFVEHVAPRDERAQLVLAGPATDGVDDDPEGARVLDEVRREWEAIPALARRRVHLATLPMEDAAENGLMVNALQRRADVVVQKSLAEGFGLTVTEAMWKERPVVGARVGGIRDQLEGGAGVLVEPADLAAFGDAVVGLLGDADAARALGAAARRRVCERYLPQHLYTAETRVLERVTARL
jgi:trehalose synthase